MKTRAILGHIDCPTCGTAKGMRVTHDRNGEPFGYCEAECSQQLRIGGDARRVAAFVARYPWAAGAPVTGTAPAPVTAAATEEAKGAALARAIKLPAPAPAKAKAPAPAPYDPFAFLKGAKA